MIEKRALLAIGISCLILVGWTLLFPPPQKPVPPAGSTPSGIGGSGSEPPQPAAGGTDRAVAGHPDEPGTAGSTTGIGSATTPGGDTSPAPKLEAPEGSPPVVVETDVARIEFANPGARLVSWRLKKYLDHAGNPYELVSPSSRLTGVQPLDFKLEDKALEALLNTKARFAVERRAPRDRSDDVDEPVPAAETEAPGHDTQQAVAKAGSKATEDPNGAKVQTIDGEELRFVYSDGHGIEALKTFVFRNGSYLVELSASVTRASAALPARIVWGPGIGTPTDEDRASSYYHGGTAVVDFGTGAKRYYAQKASAAIKLDAPVHWAGLEEPYFAAVFIAPQGVTDAEIHPIVHPPAPTGTTGTSQTPVELVTELSIVVPAGRPYTMFVGPKDYQLLLGLHSGLADLVNFAPTFPVIGPLVGGLAKVLYAILRWLHAYVGNYGLAIIILTTVIKIAFYPLTQRAMVKMRAVQQQMQKLQPKVTAIREKYRKAKDAASRAKMNEDIMALYRREGVNPMASLGGCLPLLLQLPILSGFYCVLTVSIELRHAPFFGWIGDLSRRDPYYITPLLMGISMFVQQKMAMTTVTDPQQRMQQRMMLVMPIIFTYTFLSLPSGLVLYWLVNNVLGIVQQVLINRQARAMEAAGEAAAGKA